MSDRVYNSAAEPAVIDQDASLRLASPERTAPPEEWRRCTGLQRAMILSTLKSKAKATYVQQLVVSLPFGTVESIWSRATQIGLQRHAGLMARFQFRDGELRQTRLQNVEENFNRVGVLDLGGEKGSSDERLDKWLALDREEALPLLEDKPAWRSKLLRFPGVKFAWVWTHHHALCDAASYAPLLVDIFAKYDQLRETGRAPAEPASPHFLHYLSWLETRDWTSQKKAWQSRIGRKDCPTLLPEVRAADHSLEAGGTARSYRALVELTSEEENNLRAFCAQSDLTFNTLVLAAVALWLARMQGESKTLFAVMRAARKSAFPNADRIVGPLVNTVPLTIDVPDNLSVAEWLRAVRRNWSELRDLEHCSLAQIAEWTGFGHAGLELPVVVNFQRAKLPEQLRTAGLPSERRVVQLRQKNDVPLLLEGFEMPRFELSLIAQPGAYDQTSLAAAAGAIGAALRVFARDVSRSLGTVELLTARDEEILRQATRGPRVEVPTGPAQEMIEHQIRTQPDAIAIEEPRARMTFREFGEISRRVAENIAARSGVREVVAVLLPPSSEVLCAMLGSLRAGAAFLLINPDLPAAERAAMLARLPIALAIAGPDVAEETRRVVERVFSFAEMALQSLVRPETRRLPRIDPHDLAYLVHTSGSTGEKKFVEVEHHSLADTLSAMVRLYQYRPGDRRLSMGSPGNDYFIGEILVALAGGGTMVFPKRCGALSISDYLAELHRERITVSGIPAAYWHEWVRSMDEDRPVEVPADLRLVICSMEKANPRLLQKWLRLVSQQVRWLNVYGPAEATVAVTAWDPAAAPDRESFNVPIGRPFGNSEMYVLDSQRRRVPVGACGEIAIAGPVVARGYRNMEEVTREKFVTNPFATSPEFDRLYLTGDYGFLNDHAEFVFLERRDRQVKIRGYRVELGEIDVILEEHEQIQHAVVTLEGADGEQRLIAHLVPAGAFDERRLLDWMKTRLPAHMRPAGIVLLNEMPLMPTGKVDRIRLSETYCARPLREAGEVTDAENKEEALLHSLWAQILGPHAGISRTDSFFDLGGDSLLAVRFLAQLENDHEIDLSVHDLFSNPTIAGLARLIRGDGREQEFSSLAPLNAGGPGKTLFIVHGWSGDVFHCMDFARALNGVRPVFGLQAVEHAGQARHETVVEMARHYADEMMRSHPGIEYELLGYSLGGMIAYATACELVRRKERVQRLYLLDTTPMNLPRWVHLRRVFSETAERVLPHLRELVTKDPLSWYDYWRERRRSFRFRFYNWPSSKNRNWTQPPNPDYYLVATENFVPERSALTIELFTPSDRPPTSIFWRHLTSGRVANHFIEAPHEDLFGPRYLDAFLRVFKAASEV